MADDYYQVLGVPKSATQDQIKKAYRDLAMKLHPDRNKEKGSEEHFKKVNEAYAVLSDAEKRQKYDAYGPDAFNQQFSQEDIFRGSNINDILREMGVNFNFGGGSPFGNMYGAQDANTGRSLLYHMDITLREASTGAKKEVSIKHIGKCSRCAGSGAEPGSRVIKCSECKGAGNVRTISNTIFGRMQVMAVCNNCGGAGSTYEKKCRTCSGKGSSVANEKVQVSIPAGVRDGMRLRLEGMGDFGKNGQGDLFIEIGVESDREFERDGDDLHVSVKVPFYTTILGGNISVPTLKGPKSVMISPGTQQNEEVKVRGEGIKHLNSSGSGDLIATIKVDIPKSLSRDEEETIKRFRELHEGKDKKKFGIF